MFKLDLITKSLSSLRIFFDTCSVENHHHFQQGTQCPFLVVLLPFQFDHPWLITSPWHISSNAIWFPSWNIQTQREMLITFQRRYIQTPWDPGKKQIHIKLVSTNPTKHLLFFSSFQQRHTELASKSTTGCCYMSAANNQNAIMMKVKNIPLTISQNICSNSIHSTCMSVFSNCLYCFHSINWHQK